MLTNPANAALILIGLALDEGPMHVGRALYAALSFVDVVHEEDVTRFMQQPDDVIAFSLR